MREISRDYEVFLNKLVDEIFDMAAMKEGITWIGLASHSGVSYGAVYRLGMRITKLPQLRTVYLLAKAVGMDLKLVEKKVQAHQRKELATHA